VHTTNTCNGKAETNSFILALGPQRLCWRIASATSPQLHDGGGIMNTTRLSGFVGIFRLKEIEEEGVECGA
jgi:hypothetical protein